jgi:peptide/nickel transport system permease protein
VIYGARTSLLIGVLVVSIAGAIGITLGALAGYIGGGFDSAVMRLVDILLAFPFLVLALAAVSIFPHATIWHIAGVLGFTFWPAICRLTRAQVMATREREYVSAVRALGAGHARVLLRHIMPNCVAPVVIWFAMSIAAAIMGEASLSFLGLGDPDSTSWGAMIYMGLSRMNFPDEWWAAVFPALALAITVLGFNLLGDYLQDALNPRLKK